MGSYVRDASSTRNRAHESILEPNPSFAHAFHELSFIFVSKKFKVPMPHKGQSKIQISVVYVSK